MNAPFKVPRAATGVAHALAAEAAWRPPEPEHRRTMQPVRRRSARAGGDWQMQWRLRLKRGEGWRMLLAAEIWDREHKAPGQRNGPLGHRGWQLLRLFVRLVERGADSLETLSMVAIARLLRCSVATVEAAKKALRRAGFLDWQRRYVETGDSGARGPSVKQTTNIYMIRMPEKAERLLPIWKQKAPPPVDFEADKAARVAQIRAWAESDQDNPLVRGLDRLAARVAHKAAGTAAINPDPDINGEAAAEGREPPD